MTKIGIDHIINEDKIRLLLQEAFVAGYQTGKSLGEIDYGKEGWLWAIKMEKTMSGGMDKE